MPLVEGAVEALGLAVRFLSWLFVEVFIEIIVKSTGHLALRALGRRSQPDSNAAVLAGSIVWTLVAMACYFAYRTFVAS